MNRLTPDNEVKLKEAGIEWIEKGCNEYHSETYLTNPYDPRRATKAEIAMALMKAYKIVVMYVGGNMWLAYDSYGIDKESRAKEPEDAILVVARLCGGG